MHRIEINPNYRAVIKSLVGGRLTHDKPFFVVGMLNPDNGIFKNNELQARDALANAALNMLKNGNPLDLDIDVESLLITPGSYKTQYGTYNQDIEVQPFTTVNGTNEHYIYDCSNFFKYWNNLPAFDFGFQIKKNVFADNSTITEFLTAIHIKYAPGDTPLAAIQRAIEGFAATGKILNIAFNLDEKKLYADSYFDETGYYYGIEVLGSFPVNVDVEDSTTTYCLIIEKK